MEGLQDLFRTHVNLIAVVSITAFAIDRVVHLLLSVLALVPGWRRVFPDPESLDAADRRAEARRRQRAIYYVLAAVFGIALASLAGIRILGALGFMEGGRNVALDVVVSGLILMGGASIVASGFRLLESRTERAEAEAHPGPMEVSGTLTLSPEASEALVRAQMASDSIPAATQKPTADH